MKKLNNINIQWLVILLLIIGIVFKWYMTSNGNIIFHMDSARDYVDVREMVELKKLRLIGPTSAIEGFYNGPGWYYLLAIPYILFQGDPYGGVILMIALWAIGGYFLYLITRKYGILALLSSQLLWFGSPYIGLSTSYSFNPHPVLFLTPLFIFLLKKYLDNNKAIWAIMTSTLGALFFQWEMNTGVFAPLVIISSIIVLRRWELFKTKIFWGAVIVFLAFLLPQIVFDLRHNFIMTNAVMRFLNEGGSGASGASTINGRFEQTWSTFYNVFIPTFLNKDYLVKSFWIVTLTLAGMFLYFQKRVSWRELDSILIISSLMIAVPFVGYIFLPVQVNSWHLVTIVGSILVVLAFVINQLKNIPYVGLSLVSLFLVICSFFTIQNSIEGIANVSKVSNDPSNLRNELNAIDFTYQKANGQNFKAYSYLPSVIDYPYQYLFWWYGLKKYGYTPLDYAYLPAKPQYISNKEVFNRPIENGQNSGLVFLIKEPDRIKMRSAWEGELMQFQKISIDTLGPLEVETRKE